MDYEKAFLILNEYFWRSYQEQGDEIEDQCEAAEKLRELGFSDFIPEEFGK